MAMTERVLDTAWLELTRGAGDAERLKRVPGRGVNTIFACVGKWGRITVPGLIDAIFTITDVYRARIDDSGLLALPHEIQGIVESFLTPLDALALGFVYGLAESRSVTIRPRLFVDTRPDDHPHWLTRPAPATIIDRCILLDGADAQFHASDIPEAWAHFRLPRAWRDYVRAHDPRRLDRLAALVERHANADAETRKRRRADDCDELNALQRLAVLYRDL